MGVERLETSCLRIGKTRSEFFRLGVHVHDQLRTIDAIGKSREILDHSRRGKLTPGLTAFEDKWAQLRARRIDCRGQSGAAASDDDHFFHLIKI